MPVTTEGYRRSLKEPALAKQLKIRDFLDNVAVQVNGSLVAGFETMTATTPRVFSTRFCGRFRSAPCACKCGSRLPRGPAI
jgi:hypothetical protein